MLRVQDVAAAQLDVIPPEFVRPDEEQPGITTFHGPGDPPEVPVIDLGSSDEAELAAAVAAASREWGMFQVVNHGIPTETIAALQRAGRQFFELPKEEKEAIAKPPGSASVEGYGTALQREVDGKKGWVDHLFHNIWPRSAINYDFWPRNPPSYREVNEEYGRWIRGVGERLLRWLSVGLGLAAEEVAAAVGGEELVHLLKINYYPPCPRPEVALGVVPHTDMSVLTLLVPNHVQGLQMFKDGRWFDVRYIPDAIIVHVGDQLQIVSNGEYKNVLHRTTVNKEEARMSWPVFLEPPPDHVVGPISKLVGEANPPKFKAKKYADYVHCKLNKLPQ